MAKQIEYYLSLNSPWSYMGGERLKRIAAAIATQMICERSPNAMSPGSIS